MKFNFRYLLSFLFPLGLILSYLIFSQMTLIDEGTTEVLNKQKGAHVFGMHQASDLNKLEDFNFDWITLVSWGYQDDFDSPNVTHHNEDSVYMQQHNQHWIQRIQMVRESGYKVFFKPHLWILNPSNGTWRSDIYPTSDENWEIWKETYRNFIFRYAEVAELGGADMFCIGVEFTKLATNKPAFWTELIEDVKCIYSGKITYAANWYEEYHKVNFWDQLDYIGIQAYFPLTDQANPTEKQIDKGWKKHIKQLKSTSKKFDRKIVFTEMGYRSTFNSASKPWEWAEHSSRNELRYSPETQASCYKAFFSNIWHQDWFAGVHLWQLRTDYEPKAINLNFTPQGKPAEQIIARAFE